MTSAVRTGECLGPVIELWTSSLSAFTTPASNSSSASRKNTAPNRHQLFVAEGLWAHNVLLEADAPIDTFFWCPEAIYSDEARKRSGEIAERARRAFRISQRTLDRISEVKPDGLVSIAALPMWDVFRGSQGRSLTMPTIEFEKPSGALDWLERGFTIYLADTDDAKHYRRVNYGGRTARAEGVHRRAPGRGTGGLGRARAGSRFVQLLRLSWLAGPRRAWCALRGRGGAWGRAGSRLRAQPPRGAHVAYHLAALVGIPYSYRAPRSYADTNILGTLNVLEAARAAGTPRVVHTSTSGIYRTADFVPITEEHPTHAQSPYAGTKIAADEMVQSSGAATSYLSSPSGRSTPSARGSRPAP